MNNESWYSAKLSDMDVVRISDSDNFVVDYDKSRGMYRVSVFEDGHFRDEYWFDCYEDKELREKDIAMPVKRFDFYNHEWWAGRCPRCNEIIRFDFNIDSSIGNRKSYCSLCGQLCDFEDC